MKPRVSTREANRWRWREWIDAWKQSDQSQQAFCAAHRLGFSSFKRWHRIFKAEGVSDAPSAAEAVRFVPVRVRESTPSNLTIRIQDDLRVEVAAGFDPHLLRRVIEVLRAP